MKKRGLAAVLAVAMTAFIFTGCGGNAASYYQRQAQNQIENTYERETTRESSKKEEAPAPSSKAEEPASSAPASEPAAPSQPEASAVPEAPAQPEPAAQPETPAEPAPAPEPAPEPEPQKTSDDTIRPEVKEAIDSYEKYIDTYCEFMSRADYGDMKWLADYAKYMKDLVEMEKKFNAIQDKDLTTAEYNYYIEVLNRCNTKMMQTANSM